jgi:hypothetical protein
MLEENKDVNNSGNAGGEGSSDSQGTVSSPEVKVEKQEVKQVQQQDSGVEKLRQQVENLNIALKKEREEGGRKVDELKSKLEETTSVYQKMKQVFVPDEQRQEQKASYLTKEEVDSVLEQKMASLKEEQHQQKKIEEYKQEIKNLETQWDGKGGKPVYNDDEVLNWQREQGKTYLSPEDAFFQMKHNEILDYEVKQKLTSQKPVQNVEQPGSVPGVHEPTRSSDNINLNTRKAVMEALEDASKEM